MKATGVVRKVDSLGRVVLPMELRKMFLIDDGDAVELFVNEDSIVLKKYKPGCHECGEMLGLIQGSSVTLCRNCLSSLVDRSNQLP